MIGQPFLIIINRLGLLNLFHGKTFVSLYRVIRSTERVNNDTSTYVIKKYASTVIPKLRAARMSTADNIFARISSTVLQWNVSTI